MQHTHEHHARSVPTETAGLAETAGTEVLDVVDRDSVQLRIAPIA